MSAMHLSPEELQSFVDGSSDSDTEAKISNHVRECVACAEALSAAARFEEQLYEVASAEQLKAEGAEDVVASATIAGNSAASSNNASGNVATVAPPPAATLAPAADRSSNSASPTAAPIPPAPLAATGVGSRIGSPSTAARRPEGSLRRSFRRAARVLIPLAMAASLLYVLTLRSKPIDVVAPPEESAAIPAVICPDGPDQSACVRTAHARGLIVGYPISAGAPDIGAAPLKASEWSFE